MSLSGVSGRTHVERSSQTFFQIKLGWSEWMDRGPKPAATVSSVSRRNYTSKRTTDCSPPPSRLLLGYSPLNLKAARDDDYTKRKFKNKLELKTSNWRDLMMHKSKRGNFGAWQRQRGHATSERMQMWQVGGQQFYTTLIARAASCESKVSEEPKENR